MLENKMELKQSIGREIKGTKTQQTEQEEKKTVLSSTRSRLHLMYTIKHYVQFKCIQLNIE